MTKPTIEDLRDALARMVKGEHRLHTPPQDTDKELMLAAALDELERLRKVADVAKEWRNTLIDKAWISKTEEEAERAHKRNIAAVIRLRDAVDELEKFEESEVTER